MAIITPRILEEISKQIDEGQERVGDALMMGKEIYQV